METLHQLQILKSSLTSRFKFLNFPVDNACENFLIAVSCIGLTALCFLAPFCISTLYPKLKATILPSHLMRYRSFAVGLSFPVKKKLSVILYIHIRKIDYRFSIEPNLKSRIDTPSAFIKSSKEYFKVFISWLSA